MSKDLGKSTSYAYYVAEGGTKTPQEYGEMLVNIDTVATRAEEAADSAAESATGALNSKNAAQTAATTATNKASEATTAATTATNKAAEAQADADAAALDASQALSAASTATTKATEATTAAATATSAATTATTAKDDAVSAKTAAQTAQTGAETAAASVQSSAAQITQNTSDISELKEDLSIFSEQINEVSVVLNATIANINGNYTLYPNENERIICFPVTSGKTYTVFKGYVMPYARIAYCASVPQLNSVVTGYGDFSSVDTYKTFTATQTGYACVKIHALTDAETIAQAMEKCLAYEGSYNVDYEQKSTILSNILTLNDTNVGSLIDRTNNIEHVNIIGGKIQGIISDNVIIASSTLAVTLWCPVVAGKRYTIDKKYNSAYTRIGYTSTVPKVGSAVTNYTIADGSNGRIAYTFTALESGYAVLFVSNSTQELADLISANAIVYEGDYHEFYDRGTCKLSDNVANANRVFYCGADRELDTLVKGITEATKYMDSILYVDAGTYDLVEEFGQDYFDNATETTYGLILKNRIHVVFSSNSKVICHYNGDNQYAHSIFSPFNAGAYGFTLENLNLQCSNCRYAVHDELASSPNQYKSEYLNCKMSIDNSANADWSSHHVIGGGLGANGEIVIRNCVFGSDDATIRWGVSYHIPSATSVTSYRSTLLIENCYFDTGAITLQTVDNMPPSTSDSSEYMIVGNSFPTKYSGTDAQGIYNTLTHSANVREWNNVIRDAVA